MSRSKPRTPERERPLVMTGPDYPSMFEINTRVWLRRLSREAGQPIGLGDVPDAELDRLGGLGFDWVWLMSVWETGAAGRVVSRSSSDWRAEFQRALPDLTEDDICGSGFAVRAYHVGTELGGNGALATLRARLAVRGVRLMLDFVPNHVALDHPWVGERPEYFVAGTLEDAAARPDRFIRVEGAGTDRVLAYGKDPNFPGWPDTLQLNYSNPKLQTAMTAELDRIAAQCDGVRCDMAMLVLPDIFRRTWGLEAEPFWPSAIAATRARHPGFTFVAEAYWDLEWELQQQGFDFCYDKRLYDRLQRANAHGVRAHLAADTAYQRKLVRFLENHDEERAATSFSIEMHKAAAVITYLAPGLRLFHQGQLEGAKVRLPTHLCRAPAEGPDPELAAFYRELLSVLSLDVFRVGTWSQLVPDQAWEGNPSHHNIIAGQWSDGDGRRIVVAVNFANDAGQCRLRGVEMPGGESAIELNDLINGETYLRDLKELGADGLYIGLDPWRFSVFDLTRTGVDPLLELSSTPS